MAEGEMMSYKEIDGRLDEESGTKVEVKRVTTIVANPPGKRSTVILAKDSDGHPFKIVVALKDASLCEAAFAPGRAYDVQGKIGETEGMLLADRATPCATYSSNDWEKLGYDSYAEMCFERWMESQLRKGRYIQCQRPVETPIGLMHVDFAILDEHGNITELIEIDGSQHADSRQRDAERDTAIFMVTGIMPKRLAAAAVTKFKFWE